jgi:hypothetical protein
MGIYSDNGPAKNVLQISKSADERQRAPKNLYKVSVLSAASYNFGYESSS